jgi:hypothetical protein
MRSREVPPSRSRLPLLVRVIGGAVLIVLLFFGVRFYLTSAVNHIAVPTMEESRLGAQASVNAEALRQRLARVRVQGVFDSSSPVVIVELAAAQLQEAREVICAGAERRLRRPVAGLILRVQEYRGSEPALDAGTVRCP